MIVLGQPKNVLIGICEVSLFDLVDDVPTPFQRLPLLPDLKTSGSKSISSTSMGKTTREAGEISFELTYKCVSSHPLCALAVTTDFYSLHSSAEM